MQSSFPCSQPPTTHPCPQLHKSSPHPPILYLLGTFQYYPHTSIKLQTFYQGIFQTAATANGPEKNKQKNIHTTFHYRLG